MKQFLLGCLLLIAGGSFGQKITVAELQLKLEGNKTEEIMYGFAAGDRVIVALKADGSALGEVSILQYPDVLKFRGQNIREEKCEFTATDKGVFVFRFTNTARGKRTMNVTIQRVPDGSATRNFNTAVKWATVQDTAWTAVTKDVMVGYDTLKVQKTRKVVASENRYEELVIDKSQRVNAKSSFSATRTFVEFSLPVNEVTKYESKKVVAWAYWVGVGEESNEFWKQNRKMIVGAVQGATTFFTTPLGGIAAGAVTNLVLPVNGEDVEYAISNEQAKNLFMAQKDYKAYDNGKGIAAYKRFTESKLQQGKFYVLLVNDNLVQPIDVNVKVSAIIEHIKYKDEKYTDYEVKPRYEKKIVKEPQISSAKVPVTYDYR
ncbi:hypothetical protein ACLI08_08145 [Flavobacterium sp. RNTU_13]|uniref:hypothetical protein n=1 Tax=Flavobacterium sp. RNTU_13 TaxID=3375145 RepID=UPI0039868656